MFERRNASADCAPLNPTRLFDWLRSRQIAGRPSVFSTSLALLVTLAVLCLSPTAQAGSPLHAVFTGAQSVVPTGSLSYPYRVAVDASGNLYVANTQGNEVLKETLTNDGTYSESVVVSSGLATPYGVAVDPSGNVYIADNGHNRVVKEAPSGSGYTQTVVTTSALSYPTGVAVDASGNLYIADTGHGRILKEVPSGSSYTETALTYASNFAQITGIAVDSSGNIFVSDIDNSAVYEETYSAGSYTPSTVPTNGLNYPYDLTVDSNDTLYIADYTNKRVVLETYSGGSYTQSVMPTYNLGGPLGIAVDASGNVILADTFGQDVKKVSKAGGNFGPVNVGSAAGPIYMLFEFEGGAGGASLSVASTAELTLGATGLDFSDSKTGNCSASSYQAGESCAIGVNLTPTAPGQRVGAAQLVGSSGVLAQGSLEGTGVGPQVNFLAPEDFFASDVIRVAGSFAPYDLTNPFDAALDGSGNVYVVDYNLNTVYMETVSTGILTPGTPPTFTQSIVASGLNNPEAVAVDGAGNVYIVDSGNNQILKETNVGGTWTGTPILTGLNFPTGIALDWQGNLYFSSFNDGAVYKATLSQGVYGIPISLSFPGLLQPRKIALDGSGNLYIADTGNSRVVMEIPSGAGYTQWVLGSGMHYPYAVAVDASGSVYVADTINSRILKESLVGGVYTQSVLIPGPPAYGLTLDAQGNMYFPDPADATVFQINFNNMPYLSFATTELGVESSDSPQSFFLFNIGNAPLSVSVPSSGTNPAPPAGFTLDSSTTCPVISSSGSAGTVVPGSNCMLSVGFIPVAAGTNAGSLVLSDNNLNNGASTQSIPLTGAGDLAPTSTTASSATVSYSPNAQTVTLSATVTSTYGTVNAGTVTFTLLQGSTPIGTATTSATLTNGTASVSYTLPGGTAAGPYTIQAVFNAGGAFDTSSDNTQILGISQVSQTIGFTAPATPQTYAPGLTISLSATGGASGNGVVFSLDGSSSGTGTIAGSTLTVTGAGTLVIDANQAANGNYTAAAQAQVTVVVNKASQTIDFTAPATPQTFAAGLTISLSATGGASGNGVVFSVDGSSSGTGTIAGSTLTVTGAGTLLIDANQAANGNYTAAAQAQVTVVVNKASQTIDFTAPATPQSYTQGMTISLSATGGASGNGVVFSLDGSSSGTGTIVGSTLTVTGIGTLVIDANQAGNGNYAAAAQAQVTVVVGKGTATITLGSLNQTYNGSPEAATASTTPSGLAVSLTYNTSATVPTAAGSYAVVATVNTADYTGTASGTLAIAQAASAVSLHSSVNPVLLANATILTATVSSAAGTPTGSVTFLDGTTPLGSGAVNESGVATLSTAAIASGSNSITAVYSGDTNFATASSIALTQNVEDFNLTITASGGTAGATTVTVLPGGVAVYTFTVSPLQGETFPGAISLSASGLPSGATYTFLPATLAAGAGSTQVTLTVNLPQLSAANSSIGMRHTGRAAEVAQSRPASKLPLLALALLLLPFSGKMRRASRKLGRVLPLLLLLAGFAAIAGLSGCGGTSGYFGQGPANYTITVTGTSGALSHSTSVTLTVQ